MITREGVKPFPPTGYRTLDARSAFFYGVTGITPAMAMRLPGIGSQYLFAMLDSNKEYFDGARTYKVTLPKGIPEAKFWSFTLYDNQTRSMLDTPQRYPRAGSQSYPSPAAEAGPDGSTIVYFGPTQPAGVKRGNWIQTMPGQGLVRHPAPLQPARTVLREDLAPERDRNGSMSRGRGPAALRGRITARAVTGHGRRSHMAKLRFKISMSLDRFVAGPGQSVENPLGIGGGRLHEWAFRLAGFVRSSASKAGRSTRARVRTTRAARAEVDTLRCDRRHREALELAMRASAASESMAEERCRAAVSPAGL